MRYRFTYLSLGLVTYCLLLTGCGGSSGGGEESSPSSSLPPPPSFTNNAGPKQDVSIKVSYSVNEDGALRGSSVSVVNADLSISIEQHPEHGSLELNADGTYLYKPDANYTGSDFFVIAVTNDGVFHRQEVSVVVTPVNNAPTTAGKRFSLYGSEFISNTLQAQDKDGDELQFEVVTWPENGSVELSADGAFRYEPYFGYEGPDSFSYRVSDGSLFSNEAIVMFDVIYTLLEIEPTSLFDSVEVGTSAPGKALVKNNSDKDVEINFDASMPWIISTDERKIVPAKGELEIRWAYAPRNVSPGGPYHMDIEVVSFEPGRPRLNLPVYLTVTEDVTPPGAIDDLSAQAISVSQIDLSFTAVADNGSRGRSATNYQVRYFNEAITEENWLDAEPTYTELTPSLPGTMETLSVLGLEMQTNYFFAVRAEDDMGLLGPVSNVVEGKTLGPGFPVLSPEIIPAVTLEQNQRGQHDFILGNSGSLDLRYELSVENVDSFQGKDASAQNKGGPDQFGYRWADSRERGGPSFNWIDISATGTEINGLADDSVAGPFNIGFAFDFYSETYNEFYLSSNGFLSFTPTASGCCRGLPMGNADSINNIIAWLWADLFPHTGSSKVYYQTLDNDKLVLQFDNYGEFSGPGQVDTQVILHSNGDILFQYNAFRNSMEQIYASIGIENADGSDGLQIALDNSGFLSDELAVLVSSTSFASNWVSVDPVEGIISPGEEQPVTLNYSAPRHIDTYSANLRVTDRDIPENTWLFPIELQVIEDVTPPQAVEDLTISETLFDRVTLTWTASADIGSPNTSLQAYELRFSETEITEGNWEAATLVELSTKPMAPGEIEVATVENLSSDKDYFFALRVSDLSANSSTLSNIVQTTTLKPPQVSPSDDSLSFNLPEGNSAEHFFSLTNSGDSPLNYHLRMETRLPNLDKSSEESGALAQADEVFSPVELNSLPVTGSYQQSEVIVRFKGISSQNAFNTLRSEYAATMIKRFPKLNMEIWQLPGNDVLLSTVKQLNVDPRIGYAEPNYRLSKFDVPDDIRFDELWGLHNTEQTGGLDDADIDAIEAWDITQGSDSVVVAVIDSGIDYEHDDLARNMWVNEGEIPDNGIDDDNNGYIDDVHGFNFVVNNGDPFDDNTHGTHVAGTIGAVTDNGIGVAGVSPNVRLMGVKFLGVGGSGNVDDAIEGIIYAVDSGAHILNNSWGGGGYSLALHQAIEYANEQGALFVAAAGNDGTDSDLIPTYPANYDVENVVAVAATDHNDDLASFSQYGLTTVDLGAPGVNILSTLPVQSYGSYDGTSMASPHVAGAAALIKARNFDLSPLAIKQVLMAGVDPVPALEGKTVTGGRLNVLKALQLVYTWLKVEGLTKGTLQPGESTELRLAIDSTDLEAGEYVVYIIVETNDPSSPELIVPVTLIVGSEEGEA